jgi:hypothetical protein
MLIEVQSSRSCRSLHTEKVSVFDDDGLDVVDPRGCAQFFLEFD